MYWGGSDASSFAKKFSWPVVNMQKRRWLTPSDYYVEQEARQRGQPLSWERYRFAVALGVAS